MTDTVLIIPARYGSTRLPAKPLVQIAGKTMVRRVWDLAMQAADLSQQKNAANMQIIVATDHAEIIEHVQSFGGVAVMTPTDCANGTERALAAVDALNLNPEIIINLQGDAPLTPPWFIADLIDAMRRDKSIRFATPAQNLDAAALEKMHESKKTTPASGTTVVFDKNFDALYFSKQILPYIRNSLENEMTPVWRHIGLYAYRLQALRDYLSWPQTRLEKTEGLEQLRILERGEKIRVVPVDSRGRMQCSVDSPEDVARVEAILAAQGEL